MEKGKTGRAAGTGTEPRSSGEGVFMVFVIGMVVVEVVVVGVLMECLW